MKEEEKKIKYSEIIIIIKKRNKFILYIYIWELEEISEIQKND